MSDGEPLQSASHPRGNGRLRSIRLRESSLVHAGDIERLTLEQVPVCREPVLNGVVDIERLRWRFANGSLVTFIEYRPKEEIAAGMFLWLKLYVPTDAAEAFRSKLSHGVSDP